MAFVGVAPSLCHQRDSQLPHLWSRVVVPHPQSMFLNQMWHFNLVGGVQMRAAARSLIFQKALSLRDVYDHSR